MVNFVKPEGTVCLNVNNEVVANEANHFKIVECHTNIFPYGIGNRCSFRRDIVGRGRLIMVVLGCFSVGLVVHGIVACFSRVVRLRFIWIDGQDDLLILILGVIECVIVGLVLLECIVDFIAAQDYGRKFVASVVRNIFLEQNLGVLFSSSTT